MKNIILFFLLISIIVFFSGCNFLTPEDDLNGNNQKIEKVVEKLDIEKKMDKDTQTTAKQAQQGQIPNSQAIAQQQMQPPTSQTVTQQQIQESEPQAEKDALAVAEPEVEENSALEKESMKYIDKYDKATIVTNYGKIKVEFYNEDAPLTVGNFLRLADEGFYDNTKFHRVIKGFMVQGGDPNSKDDDWSDDGKGGPGYKFKDEINDHKLVRGSFAMANSGTDTNGSQFFIVTSDATSHLDGKHTNFGEVVDGMDVVDKIESVQTDNNDHPTQDVIIEEIKLK